jgi:hypothetical protein
VSNGSTVLATNKGQMYSVDFQHTSCQSELYAVLAGAVTLNALLTKVNAAQSQTQELQLHMDNKRVIQKVQQRRAHPRMINQHCDSAIDIELQPMSELSYIEELFRKVKVNYVQSHGAHTKRKDLTDIEKIHCTAD